MKHRNAPRKENTMKKYYTVKTTILWNIGENYKSNTYKYNTKKEQEQGFNKISADLERLMKEGKIKDFSVEM